MTPQNVSRFGACALLLAISAAPAFAAATEIKGAAILEHACGKVSAKYMGLASAGKVEESVKLGTKEMQDAWAAMSKEDREMMGGMIQEMAPTEAEHTAAMKAHGVLTVDGKDATLVIQEEKKGAEGSGSSTMTQKFKIDGTTCKISR